jgi:hypothetical protein
VLWSALLASGVPMGCESSEVEVSPFEVAAWVLWMPGVAGVTVVAEEDDGRSLVRRDRQRGPDDLVWVTVTDLGLSWEPADDPAYGVKPARDSGSVALVLHEDESVGIEASFAKGRKQRTMGLPLACVESATPAP